MGQNCTWGRQGCPQGKTARVKEEGPIDTTEPSCVEALGTVVLATQVIRSEKKLMRREWMPPPLHCFVCSEQETGEGSSHHR